MARVVKDGGRYFLIAEGVREDVTEAIETEIRVRLEIERRLAEYNRDIEARTNFRLAATRMQLNTAKSHLANLLGKAQNAFDAWAKDGNPHGAMIAMRPYLSIVKKWLEDSKDND